MPKVNNIYQYFELLKKQGRLGASYLFIGSDYAPVMDILKLVVCPENDPPCNTCWDCKKLSEFNHPDLCRILPDNTSIKIEQVRQAQQFLSLKPFRLAKKLLLIEQAQTMGLDAANAFLKTLEEPPKNSLIALCAGSLDGLLPTIVSRCRRVFLPSSAQTFGRQEVELAKSFINGSQVRFKDRQQFTAFLRLMITLFRDNLVYALTGNKRLLDQPSCEIILRSYGANELQEILSELLLIYPAAPTVNERLALAMIREKL